ncbi:hypothetical protein CO101_01285 [Candidatus Berkelbacteria bacterium CG_4_9_14_3_um_filter_39_23]|uniref:AtpZ/AtpI family protein n=2 Tax=Candidatus Berkelbacteria TaxID=1618330 RepID=A0A2M7CI39_9BACT|nr:MAG: hypothetical protein COV39_01195 [Candidatus Berkelbacteria bacterium CG11_big_fil_rev_8_21_14_0_20_40_23]PIV25300.1 MAG: hypothetical protein COS38_02400 [Candidatus Berkelbacteria bacterium CG03_land_8_20_14_0_80_40_36]PIX30512.1 MAG: hypothetical protein COZ62_02280 [Candidatus Berkelbacteria bacterium CG_4_8_14_3_um_filter_39_27]PIZ28868.1 MAG: hypothetical protein COY44_01935 [Candidatus Berkelbacteria bacterium CG_4_10_14_0_8_um_filter_39_42]PJB51649.1 MAG: hypothetical protein CO
MVKKNNEINGWFVARECANLGFIIALPLVVLIQLGRWLDQNLGFKILFTLIAIPISILISALAIYFKIKRLNN